MKLFLENGFDISNDLSYFTTFIDVLGDFFTHQELLEYDQNIFLAPSEYAHLGIEYHAPLNSLLSQKTPLDYFKKWGAKNLLQLFRSNGAKFFYELEPDYQESPDSNQLLTLSVSDFQQVIKIRFWHREDFPEQFVYQCLDSKKTLKKDEIEEKLDVILSSGLSINMLSIINAVALKVLMLQESEMNKDINIEHLFTIIKCLNINLNALDNQRKSLLDYAYEGLLQSQSPTYEILINKLKSLGIKKGIETHAPNHYCIEPYELIYDASRSYNSDADTVEKAKYIQEILNSNRLTTQDTQNILDISLSFRPLENNRQILFKIIERCLSLGATLSPTNTWSWSHSECIGKDSQLGQQSKDQQLLLQWLVEHGANINTLDKADRTPLDLAIKYNKKDHIQLLKSMGAKESHELI